jgi:hypothetical protein
MMNISLYKNTRSHKKCSAPLLFGASGMAVARYTQE